MKENILQTLREIEQTNHVKVIYACVAGSRAWGLQSMDSDYDVRFIYVEQKDRYLSIDPVGSGKWKDTIEVPISKQLDMNGWELTKALRLFRKSNPSLLEWINTGIVYLDRLNTMQQMRTLQPNVFSKKASIYHYLHIVYSNKKKLKVEETVKQALATILPLLIARSIQQLNHFPSGNFHHLIHCVEEKILQKEIEAIAFKKINHSGHEQVHLSDKLSNWMTTEVEKLENYVKQLKEEKVDCTTQLNHIFRETLQQAWNKK